jgi:hypothetical protein
MKGSMLLMIGLQRTSLKQISRLLLIFRWQARCLEKGAKVLDPKGRVYSETLSAMHWQTGSLWHFCATWAP